MLPHCYFSCIVAHTSGVGLRGEGTNNIENVGGEGSADFAGLLQGGLSEVVPWCHRNR